jgi:benzoyl-CoA reductase/2-hydroxyglutaryl-CoA dehydratase subunit BcrC/BadD/HgdB
MVEAVEEIGLQELTEKQIEELCTLVEETARQYILSKAASKKIETLNISVETEGARPVTVTVDIDIVLSPSMKNFDTQRLAKEAIKEALDKAKKHLEGRRCHSKI